MIMEKPSCIKELKEIANSLINDDIQLNACISRVKNIVDSNLSAEQKITKLKELCKEHGK